MSRDKGLPQWHVDTTPSASKIENPRPFLRWIGRQLGESYSDSDESDTPLEIPQKEAKSKRKPSDIPPITPPKTKRSRARDAKGSRADEMDTDAGAIEVEEEAGIQVSHKKDRKKKKKKKDVDNEDKKEKKEKKEKRREQKALGKEEALATEMDDGDEGQGDEKKSRIRKGKKGGE